MNGYLAFLRKEMLEQARTYRVFVLLAAFLIVGLVSPLLAKVTPELLGMLAEDELGGMEIVLTREPNASDALLQYHGNFSLLPLLVILLSFGAVSAEKSRKTAPMVLVKPVSRRAFLLAKATASAAMIVGGTILAAAGCLLYTTVLFGEVDLAGFALVNGLLLLMLLAYLALTLFGSVLASSQAAAAGIGLGGFVLFTAVGALPLIGRYTPGGLAGAAADIIIGREAGGFAVSALSSAALTLLLLIAAERVLARQEL